MTKKNYNTVSWERRMGEWKKADEMEKMFPFRWSLLFLATMAFAQ
jgi:hypothetical protein